MKGNLNVEVRPITEEELGQFSTFVRDAFVVDKEWVDRWVERAIKPNLDKTRALFEDGEMKACLRLIFPRLWLGYGSLPAPGFTSVATPPENRRQGSINRMLTTVLKELRESGYPITTLYPFYFPFYKKFGFDLVSQTNEVKVNINQFQKFKPKVKGKWKAITQEQWEVVNSMYDEYCAGKFGRLSRDKEWWERQIFTGPKETPRLSYLWYNEQGEARAYIFYRFETVKDWERKMIIREMVWKDNAARNEVFAFIGNHDSQTKSVEWATSADDEVFALLDDPREAECKLEPGYMLRILDAAMALEQRPWSPSGSGFFTIALQDHLLEWNNVALRVEVRAGQAHVEKLANASEAKLSCDIRQLAQMYAGYLSPQKLYNLGMLESRDEAELAAAQNLFSTPGQPAPQMNDFF